MDHISSANDSSLGNGGSYKLTKNIMMYSDNWIQINGRQIFLQLITCLKCGDTLDDYSNLLSPRSIDVWNFNGSSQYYLIKCTLYIIHFAEK